MYLEKAAMHLAVEGATAEKLDEIEAFATMSAKEDSSRSVDDLVALDEKFHELLVGLSGNTQMLEALRNINARIQFVRWIDMTERRPETQHQHHVMLAALRARDVEAAEQSVRDHIAHRPDQIFGMSSAATDASSSASTMRRFRRWRKSRQLLDRAKRPRRLAGARTGYQSAFNSRSLCGSRLGRGDIAAVV